jgi:hypothetical protein
MAIIINEFEIIAEQPSAAQAPAQNTPTPTPAQGGPPTLRPEDIIRVAERERTRLARVRAD